MNPIAQIAESPTDTKSGLVGITIIYEDRLTGLIAKRFSDSLTASLAEEQIQTPFCWRSELVELPEIAARMTIDAAASEFVILSMRGDTGISMSLRHWIETWLNSAAGGPASLVALFDPERSRASVMQALRFHLRQSAAEARVPFFAHCAVAPLETTRVQLLTSNKRTTQQERRSAFRKRFARLVIEEAAA